MSVEKQEMTKWALTTVIVALIGMFGYWVVHLSDQVASNASGQVDSAKEVAELRVRVNNWDMQKEVNTRLLGSVDDLKERIHSLDLTLARLVAGIESIKPSVLPLPMKNGP